MDSGNKFMLQILSQLAIHYRGEALQALEKENPWLVNLYSAKPDLTKALDKFVENGGSCINKIEEHVELVRLAVTNQELTTIHGPKYAIFVENFYATATSGGPGLVTGAPRKVMLRSSANESLERTERLLLEPELKNSDFLLTARQMLPEYLDRDAETSATMPLFEIEKALRAAFDLMPDIKPTYNKTLLSSIRVICQQCLNLPPTSERLALYFSSIQSFTHKVGCPEAYEDPARNIAELRKFQASQMPFFSKLQKDLGEQVKTNREQQEIITALVFWHLMEHLPPERTRSGDKSSTARWREFWKDAVTKEITAPHVNHPLHNFMKPNAMTSPGADGLLYRTGNDLYGTISENIHGYKGGGKDGYVIEDDQWGAAVRKILTRLIPISFDADKNVDWATEQARYL